MTTDNKIIDEKVQYDIYGEARKISALSSGRIDKIKYLTGEEILPSNQRKIIEQDKFVYSPLGKTFEKKKKTVGAIKSLELSNEKDKLKQTEGIFSQNLMNYFICDKLKEIVNLQDIIKSDNLRYKSKSRKDYNFREYSLPNVFKRYT